MAIPRTAWHIPFAALMTQRAPPGFEVDAEHRFGSEPQRADLLLRRTSRRRRDDQARVLRRLWPWVRDEAIAEFKSLARPFRTGDLSRLISYGWQHSTQNIDRLRPQALTLVLIVPSVTPSLLDEIAWLGLRREALGGGYSLVFTGVHALYIASIDEVAAAERDAFLALFGRGKKDDLEARRWIRQYLIGKEAQTMDTPIEELDGYDEMLDTFLQGLPIRRRLAGVTPEEVGAALPPEWLLLCLPDGMLKALPNELLDMLPEEAREAIRKRVRNGKKKRPRRSASAVGH